MGQNPVALQVPNPTSCYYPLLIESFDDINVSNNRDILSVFELNQRAKSLLEMHLNPVWVEGEISNFSAPSSGHWYFSLKDSRAQIRCAMFRNRNMLVSHTPKPGDKIAVRGRVSLYEARGEYQMVVEHLEPAGLGALLKAFEELKKRLQEQGLFDQEHKKAIPKYIDKVALITSATGAALHDMLTVLARRNPAIHVVIVPSSVQGTDAPSQLIRALKQTRDIEDLDLTIIGRGGGSIEDLWAFNDEALARAMYDYPIPLISAVGHEVDFTIADFVADLRAATPSAAAELVAVDRSEILGRLKYCEQQLLGAMQDIIWRATNNLDRKRERLKHPDQKIEQWKQRLDRCELQLQRSIKLGLESSNEQLRFLRKSLNNQNPQQTLAFNQDKLRQMQRQLKSAIDNQIKNRRHQLSTQVTALDIVSPLATLKRGYSITQSASGEVLTSTSNVKVGDKIQARLSDGSIEATVNRTKT